MSRVSKNFKRSEFKCKCGNCTFEAVDVELLEVLEDLRAWADGPITITSGNRCADHNSAVGGAPGSKHVSGIAADIKVADISTEEVYRYLDSKYPNKYGIGLYDNWVHIDVRSEKARW